jgi:hypothetical protein
MLITNLVSVGKWFIHTLHTKREGLMPKPDTIGFSGILAVCENRHRRQTETLLLM